MQATYGLCAINGDVRYYRKGENVEKFRKIRSVVTARSVTEGAGVHLRRAIGLGDPYEYDPFLLLDDFRSDNPSDYLAGFPWHPHRGIETVTYVLKGRVTHGDSTGTEGVIGAGDVQWMTAGSGIFHQEMPEGDAAGAMYGFQLWVNLPAREKMSEPRYRGIEAASIPVIKRNDGVEIKVIAGTCEGISGPVADVVTKPLYLDVHVPAQIEFTLDVQPKDTVFAYVHEGAFLCETEGSLAAAGGSKAILNNRDLARFGEGETVKVTAGSDGARFLLVLGTPLGEPIAWHGPIVMNTQAELRHAWEELEKGTFIKEHE